MNDFSNKYGPWALVTGASSGIGMEFARQLAQGGLNLVLVARREDKLKTLAGEISSRHPVEIRVVIADLTSDDFLSTLKNSTRDLEIGLLINNAGLTVTGPVVDNSLDDELKLLDLNCRAPLVLAHEYGKQMKERRRGGIIFLSSLVAFASVPYWTSYAASKSFNLMLAEGLAAEMKEHNVDVLALCPGFTRTEFVKFARINDMMALDVEPVVQYALKKLGKSRIAVPGVMNKFNSVSTRLLPRFLNSLVFSLVIRPTQKLNMKSG